MNILSYLGVLVVEEDHLSCILACERLRLLGFAQVYAACSSGAATCILQHHEPALVLLNVDEDRTEFCGALARPDHASTLVIATSFDSEDRPRTLRHRADAFLRKPYSKAQLLRTISSLLAGRAGRRCRIVPLHLSARRLPEEGRGLGRSHRREFDGPTAS